MHDAPVTDVLVIGGGPSGSTISTLLAQRGHRVTVFERAKFPRDHVGESLLPYCYGILDELGVLEQMKEQTVRKPGVRFIDVDGRHHTTWCFGHVIKDESHLSFHVRRDRFDNLLLRNAEAHGVEVLEETRVRSADLDRPDGLVAVTVTGPDGAERTVVGRYLVDASGRDTFVANRMGWKRAHEELDRVATSAHWEGVQFNGGLDEGLLQIVYLGGDKKGWIWVIPIGADRVSIGIVVNNDHFKAQRAELRERGSADWKRDFYLEELATSPFVSEVIGTGHMIQGPVVNGDYSYRSDTKYGNNFALVGDAHMFVDPIFASGIFLSMNSAKLVAEALHEGLSVSHEVGEKALTMAYESIGGAYRLVEKAIRLFYNPTAINFAQAASAEGLIHEQHKNALAAMHYLLAGDFFNRHEEYSKVIDLLADPDLFSKFKSFVVDREELRSSTCGMDRAQVFSEFLLREVADRD
ncbi:MAG TPA: NAD(P)/FAD-dependent oxidoreductase [Acidimicrobiia bacterium]|jgi:flavin-dependent dehydrogenase|nr:NAD(P)/FAD-dependent oxidoreductase [Acidimicrobiia bacterium]